MRESKNSDRFRRATWRADVIGIWGGLATTAFTAIRSLWEGWGVAVSLLFALAVFPLAFLTCVLLPFHRQIVERIGAFLGRSTPEREVDAVLAPGVNQAAPIVSDPSLLKRLDALERTSASLLSSLQNLNVSADTPVGELAGRAEVEDINRRLKEVEQVLRPKGAGLETALGLTVLDRISQEIARLRQPMPTLLLAQLRATRAASVRDFLKGYSPEPPVDGEQAHIDQLELFVMSVDNYAGEIARLAPAWELMLANEIPDYLKRTVAEEERDMDREGAFPIGTDPRRLLALRRYRIAMQQKRWIDNYLQNQIRNDEESSNRQLMDLLKYQHVLAPEDRT
jgi:hypothetical protein